jgi:hypothetical protein
MSNLNDEGLGRYSGAKQPLVVRVTDSDFKSEVLEKLGRLEAKMDMLAGSTQPGRVQMIDDRVVALERNDIRRNVYERLLNAAISIAISVGIAWHDRR